MLPLAACLLVLILSMGLRVFFVGEVLDQYKSLPQKAKASYRTGILTPDSKEYIELAKEIVQGNWIDSGSLSRPPGYPALIAITGINPTTLLYVQALLAGLIPLAIMLTTVLILGSWGLGLAVGLVSAISPTGIGATGLVMADSPFAAFFSLGLLALVYGVSRDSKGWIGASSLFFSFAALIKPILIVWPFLSLIVYWLLCRTFRKQFSLLAALVLFFLPTLVLGVWAGRNKAREGVFTFSNIGIQNVRIHWAVRTEEWGKVGRKPSSYTVRRNRNQVRERLLGLPGPQKVDAFKNESISIMRQYPAEAVKAFVMDSHEGQVAGWDYFHRQFPFATPEQKKTLNSISLTEMSLRKAAMFPILLAFAIAFAVTRIRPSGGGSKLLPAMSGLTLIYYYFAASAGVTFWTGPRVLYPVEGVGLILLALLSAVLFRAFSKKTESGES